MALSTDYAAAQLTYLDLAVDFSDAHPGHAHHLTCKLCSEYPSQADLLWLVQNAQWQLLEANFKRLGISETQSKAVLAVQNHWLRVLDHHGRDLTQLRGCINLTDLF